MEWNYLEINIKNSESYSTFKKSTLRLIRQAESSTFKVPNPSSNLNLVITKLRLGFSHLRQHEFRHNFQNTLEPICSCGKNNETTFHYLLSLLKLFK